MITQQQYNTYRPFEQGYVRYMSTDELDPLIPMGCPYDADSWMADQWLKGYRGGGAGASTLQ